jgi:hypothetical protein
MKRWIACVCLLCLCFGSFCQDAQGEQSPETGDQASIGETPEAGDESKEPEPYTDEEFPLWAHNLRRFEIITLGTLPMTFLVSFVVYDIIRYASSGFDPDYALLGSPTPIPYTTEEKIGVVVAACSASLLIALADYLIGRARSSEN